MSGGGVAVLSLFEISPRKESRTLTMNTDALRWRIRKTGIGLLLERPRVRWSWRGARWIWEFGNIPWGTHDGFWFLVVVEQMMGAKQKGCGLGTFYISASFSRKRAAKAKWRHVTLSSSILRNYSNIKQARRNNKEQFKVRLQRNWGVVVILWVPNRCEIHCECVEKRCCEWTNAWRPRNAPGSIIK